MENSRDENHTASAESTANVPQYYWTKERVAALKVGDSWKLAHNRFGTTRIYVVSVVARTPKYVTLSMSSGGTQRVHVDNMFIEPAPLTDERIAEIEANNNAQLARQQACTYLRNFQWSSLSDDDITRITKLVESCVIK